jgi:hypothetical protein
MLLTASAQVEELFLIDHGLLVISCLKGVSFSDIIAEYMKDEKGDGHEEIKCRSYYLIAILCTKK